MTIEHKITPDRLQYAELGGINHPILDVLARNKARLQVINRNHLSMPQEEYRDHYQFLINELTDLADFTVTPEELVSIWASSRGIFPYHYQRYTFATAIVGAHVVQPLGGAWKNAARSLFDTSAIPREITRDRKSGQVVLQRAEGFKQMIWGMRDLLKLSNPGHAAEVSENFNNGMMPLYIYYDLAFNS